MDFYLEKVFAPTNFKLIYEGAHSQGQQFAINYRNQHVGRLYLQYPAHKPDVVTFKKEFENSLYPLFSTIPELTINMI